MKFFFLLLFCVISVFASDRPETILKNASIAYEQNKYEEAISLWNSQVEKGLINAEILYNLCNAYYRLGKIAKPYSIMNTH